MKLIWVESFAPVVCRKLSQRMFAPIRPPRWLLCECCDHSKKRRGSEAKRAAFAVFSRESILVYRHTRRVLTHFGPPVNIIIHEVSRKPFHCVYQARLGFCSLTKISSTVMCRSSRRTSLIFSAIFYCRSMFWQF